MTSPTVISRPEARAESGAALRAPREVSCTTKAITVGATDGDRSFESVRGTSFAAPQVSGIIASLREKFPSSSVEDLVGLLKSTGNSVGGADWCHVPVHLGAAQGDAAVPPGGGVLESASLERPSTGRVVSVVVLRAQAGLRC